MIEQTITTDRATAPDISCDPAARITKSLLGYGVLAGPIYVTVSLVQALTRPGFDLLRHPWSLLGNGDLGWVQITNLILTGLMTVAAAVGLRRAWVGRRGHEEAWVGRRGHEEALRPGRGATWTPRLLGVYGVSLVSAGVFRADPALGFPPGTPAGPTTVSWHGMLHFASGAVGFACLIAACLVIARRFAAERRPGWARFSRVTGVLFLAGFLSVAAGAGAAWANVAFTVAIVLVWAWFSAVSVHLYRRRA